MGLGRFRVHKKKEDLTDMSQPRGIRNNNPGNIEYNGTNWRGLEDPAHDGRYCIFIDAVYGIRALARVLKTYYNKHGLNTVSGIINRWAPPVENDTSAYIAHVAAVLGVDANEPFNVLDKLPELVEVIIRHENGVQPYSLQTIINGVELA